jgi:hypothetical protein
MCDLRFLPQALVLHRSLERHSPSVRLRVLCLDGASERMLADAWLRVETVSLGELEASDPELAGLKRDRTWREYCWTATPAFCRREVDRVGESDVVVWVDADLEFLRDPHALLDELGDGSILLTPHEYYRTHPMAATAGELSECWGRFNGGAIAFRGDDQGRAAAELWRRRSIEWCHDRREPGRYGNQLHLVDFPQRFTGARILRIPGGGLGPWNAAQYQVARNGAGIVAEGLPVTFYHHQSLRLYRLPAYLRPLPLPGNVFQLPRSLVGRINPRYKLSRPERNLIWRPYLDRLAEATAEVAHLANGSASDSQVDVLTLERLLEDCQRRLEIRTGFVRRRLRKTRRALGLGPRRVDQDRQRPGTLTQPGSDRP